MKGTNVPDGTCFARGGPVLAFFHGNERPLLCSFVPLLVTARQSNLWEG